MASGLRLTLPRRPQRKASSWGHSELVVRLKLIFRFSDFEPSAPATKSTYSLLFDTETHHLNKQLMWREYWSITKKTKWKPRERVRRKSYYGCLLLHRAAGCGWEERSLKSSHCYKWWISTPQVCMYTNVKQPFSNSTTNLSTPNQMGRESLLLF